MKRTLTIETTTGKHQFDDVKEYSLDTREDIITFSFLINNKQIDFGVNKQCFITYTFN